VQQTVIDLGCGDRKQAGSVGIDLAPLAGVDVIADIGRGLPLRDSSVDAVHASHVLEHVDDLVSLMNEIWRVCKPGARVHVTIPHATSSYMTWRDPTHRRGLNLSTLTYFDKTTPDGSRFAYYSRADFRCLYSKLRFSPVRGDEPPRGRNPVAKALTGALELAANRSPYAQYLCERWWGGWFGIAEAYAVLEAVK
jgi:SAM-dependent methyltransferase